MNKIFKVKWNSALQRFDVTSELTKGKSKSSSGGSKQSGVQLSHTGILTIGALALALSAPTMAVDIDLDDFDAPDGGHIQRITGSDKLTSTNWNSIKSGDKGYRSMTLAQANALGLLTGDGVNYLDEGYLAFGNRIGYEYIDPTTGNTITFQGYDNAQLRNVPLSGSEFVQHYAVGADGQYVDRNLIQVEAGGSLEVDVGGATGPLWFNDLNNRLELFMKGKNQTSSVFKVSSVNAAAPATLNYLSKTVVHLGNFRNTSKKSDDPVLKFSSGFSGDFSSAIGNQSVNNLDDLKNYNSALISAVQSGLIQASQYQSEFEKAYSRAEKLIYVDDKIADDDASRLGMSTVGVAYILGDGGAATINVDTDASIQGFNTDISLIRLVNGATLNNYGSIGLFSNSSADNAVITARDSVVNNFGVIDAGTNKEMMEYETSPGTPIGSFYSGGQKNAITANNAIINNSGVINVAPAGNYVANIGISLNGNSSLVNSGNINIYAAEKNGSVYSTYSHGVLMGDNATLRNEGTVYLGREAQRNIGEAVNDLEVNSPNNRLVTVRDYAEFINEASGNLTLGSLTQGAYGVIVQGAGAKAENKGDITINGKTGGAAPLQNIAMMGFASAKNVLNSGTITLNGVNAVALMANSVDTDSGTTVVTNKGTINITEGVDAMSKTANYGMWADGQRAIATNGGIINLNGDGAIGAHARNGGTIDITDNGEMHFNGKNQTGYYVYGAGSKIVDGSTTTQAASAEGSTLYRIDGGASFDGSASTTRIDASGKNATALLVTSNANQSTLDTGKMTILVSGEGATGVRVEGSAKGTLSDETDLTLSGAGSSAGIVDGSYTDIVGNSSQVGRAVLTSLANLTSANTAANAIGYIARNGGTLDHQGSIDFTTAGTTGVLVEGGTLNNSGNINVNGVAVNIQGENSAVTNTGTITASDGVAAINVGSGANLTLDGLGQVKASGSAHGILLDTGATGLIVKDASIEMNPVGDGNAIENKAEIAGIKLDNTQITVDNGAGVRTAASMASENSGKITVNGSGSGLLIQNADSSTADSVLDMSNSRNLVIDVNSADGSGIVTNIKGDVKSGASVNVNDASGGPALKVGGTTAVVEQSGRLVSKSTTNPVVDVNNDYVGSFINRGDIIANSAAQVALEITSGLSGVHFVNAQGGNIVGQVNLTTSHDHTVDLQHGSTATDITSSSGNDSYNLVNIDATDGNLFKSLNGGAGDDKLNLRNSQLTLAQSGKTITGFEQVNLENSSTLTLDNILLSLGNSADDAVGTGFNITDGSTLVLKQSADTFFNSHISGSGMIAASTAGNAFDFTANNASNTFTGTLGLTDSKFALDGLNTQALTYATLLAGTDSRITVADSVQRIGGLNFDGGTVVFNTGTPGDTVAKGVVQTSGLMDISGRGTVEINPGSVTNHHVLPPQTVSLLEQDEGDQGIKLAGGAIPVQGSGGNLELRDTSGNLITDKLNTNVLQDGNVVANATYDYRLTSGQANDGLYVTYGLTQLDLLTQGNDALVLNAFGKKGNSADMSAKMTGIGDLAIDTGTGHTVSLSNMDNSYSGKTDVRSGSLVMNNDNVLGQTSELSLAANTGFDMNGYNQTIGALNTTAGSVANLNGGTLGITHGGSVNGNLQGSGALNVNGGTLTINGSNAGLAATTSIASGADVQLNNTIGLGSGNIVNEGLLALKNAAGALFNSLSGSGETNIAQNSDVILLGDNGEFAGKFSIGNGSALTASTQSSLGSAEIANEGALNLASSHSWLMNNTITGSGELNQNGSGVVTLSQQAAQYTGDTQVNAGGLQLGSVGNNVTLASANLNIAAGAVAGGFGGTSGNVTNSGKLQLGEIIPAAKSVTETLRFNVGGNFANSGDIILGGAGAAAGNQLHIAGNYLGNNGHITLNTALGDDNSTTDKMIVAGDTSGTTLVSVNNAGGSGAKTLNGIEVISVGGKSDGEFVKDGRIVAGAYDYNLVRGESANSNNWYLTNLLSGVIDPGEGSGGGNKDEIIKIYRPESAAYAANMAAANNLFNTRLHDRLGETHYVDALTGEEKVTSMWLRNVGGHTRSSDSSGQMKTQANRYVMQMGGDIAQWTTDGANRYHLGVMAGYANQQSNSRNHISGQKADGTINGYSTGIYATWLQDTEEKSGAYLDSWAQYSWFDNTVKGDSLTAESYKSKGITASLETGYTWKIGEKNERESYFVQPQAQITWMGVQADEIREQNGTRVKGTGDGNIQTRLGARTFIKGHSAIDDGKDRVFQPFIEANWIHNTKEFGSELNGVKVTQKGTRNLGELKVGVEGQITKNVNLWGNIGQQMGDKGYSDTSALLGVKVNF
ncbi:autotransporter family porin [Pantoea sp. AG1095]|uniref:autotransporter outer membrane beta-barrel domain-containing protein n=1 Tax=Pantoea sp. AG1095 TaxID=2184004 RepID=UPI000DA0C214|nr:autotransporter outer membrane beta-barrel domain-containing protein [Pantoea sp. AG1095]PYG47217.1 autotransporter family porin [Pantoea sp. AG1095]